VLQANATALHLRSILDNISDGVLVTDATMQVQLCNPAASRLLGENCRYLKDSGDPAHGIFETATGEPARLQTLLDRFSSIDDRHEYLELFVKNPAVPDGRFAAFSARPLAGAINGGWVIVLHDLTGEKAAREQLITANQELDAFCYSISHDLRAPLRSLTGFSQILVEDYGKKLGPDAIRICDVIVRAAEKMGRLIDDLLKFSRITRHDIVSTGVNMEEMFRNVLGRLQQEQPGLSHHISVSPMPAAFADPQLVQQAVYNLVSNAVKYSARKSHPEIEIGARTIDGETVYYVSDNGEGFDMRYYHKLFEVFQRLHSDRDFEGTGVGLSIVKRIIDRHHGRIWAESSPGSGATFYFTLNSKKTQRLEHVTEQLHGNTNTAC
jgi:light-regulated signal transduction histidine kinase (bacteriophytochrome)